MKKHQRDYTYRSMHRERQYGPYWYSALWRIIRPVLVVGAALLVVAGLVSSGWKLVYNNFLAPVEENSQRQIAFTIPSGRSLTGVSNDLEEAGLIRNRTVFKYYCDFAGMGQKIQAGNYLLTPGMNMQEIAEQLTMGDGNPIVRNITLIPGWTLEEFADDLVKKGVLTNRDEFLSLCRTGEAFDDFYYVDEMRRSGTLTQRRYALEGYLSPNTYEVYMDATAEDIIRKMLQQMERAFPADKQDRAAELGYTMDQILTLASLIEKEAKNEDFAKVSAVFHNRLNTGMKLQSDVTIHYVTGVRKMALTNTNLALNSPYNTYQVTGLPVGPVCNPSAEAIHAALYPDEAYLAENYLYFCAKDPESGTLHFSRTLQDHEQAVAIYAPLWQQYDAERNPVMMAPRRMPELLCPAGTMEALKTALHFGADAVYGAMKRFGLRAFAGNFEEAQLREAVSLCHARGKKFYLTMNVFPFDDQMDDFVDAARTASQIGVDAAIVADLGAIVTLRREVPQLPLHVSTQASTVNAAAVKHYQELGCQRVILARETSLERIGKLIQSTPGMEIETFVHGASCMAYSGRCLLSAALNGRSGNQGECSQPCRWQYAVMEQKRPGEYLPVAEDENGTYIFSAKDLNLMPLLPDLASAGVASLKIEGRMKTEYYVATVTGAYRRALSMLAEGEDAFRAALPSLMAELNCASHRDSDTGFLLGAPQNPGGAEGFHQDREFIARVMEDNSTGKGAALMLKNRFYAGDELELMTASGIVPVKAVPFLREKTGETLDTLGIAGEIIRMDLPCAVKEGDLVRGQVRNHRR